MTRLPIHIIPVSKKKRPLSDIRQKEPYTHTYSELLSFHYLSTDVVRT